MVDGENQLVVATAVTENASVHVQLISMTDGVAVVCDETLQQVLNDLGYGDEQDLPKLEKRGTDGYLALTSEGKALANVHSHE